LSGCGSKLRTVETIATKETLYFDDAITGKWRVVDKLTGSHEDDYIYIFNQKGYYQVSYSGRLARLNLIKLKSHLFAEIYVENEYHIYYDHNIQLAQILLKSERLSLFVENLAYI
jgi:hypothetical protein